MNSGKFDRWVEAYGRAWETKDPEAAAYLFVEDARSFAAKLELMKKLKLRGFSVWVLGPEDPGIWAQLKSFTMK